MQKEKTTEPSAYQGQQERSGAHPVLSLLPWQHLVPGLRPGFPMLRAGGVSAVWDFSKLGCLRPAHPEEGVWAGGVKGALGGSDLD